MMDKGQAAIFALEAMGWKFDGKHWEPPRSKWGLNALQVHEAMAGHLQDQLDLALSHAAKDVYYQSVVDQLGPLLAAWEDIKPN